MSERCAKVLSERPASADFLLSVASSAISSYRFSSVAKPLPFETKESAEAAFRSISDGGDVSQMLEKLSSMSPVSLKLLDFLLHPDGISLRKVSVSKWAEEHPVAARVSPDFIFEVDYGVFREEYPNPLARAKQAEFAKFHPSYDRVIAYHGTDLCNVHNILRESLKNDPKLSGRNGQIFGKGIYLSEDPVVACNFLSYGSSWKHCRLGHSIACLLECEVLLGPDVERGSKEGQVPEKYVLARNDCMVRVKRVLVYTEKKKPIQPRDFRWLGRALVILIALAMLAMILMKRHSASKLVVWPSAPTVTK